jgi:putative oxidoreductase
MQALRATQPFSFGAVVEDVFGLYTRACDLLGRVPFSAVQLVSRLAVADVFWRSSQVKLASWQSTIQLFANEYKVPVLPPETAAYLATATEIAGSLLLVAGLLSRAAALALLGLVAVIQFAVYPENWPDHILWTSLLLLILTRGPGVVSLDYLLGRAVGRGTR